MSTAVSTRGRHAVPYDWVDLAAGPGSKVSVLELTATPDCFLSVSSRYVQLLSFRLLSVVSADHRRVPADDSLLCCIDRFVRVLS